MKDKLSPTSSLRTRLAIRTRIAKIFGLVDPQVRFKAFRPYSYGSRRLLSRLTELSVNQTFPLLSTLSKNESPVSIHQYSLDEFCKTITGIGNGEYELKQNLDRYGSDKASLHHYHPIYSSLLKERSSIQAILEIGLGTNNTSIASNMGNDGKPGASLRAFRDFLPNAMIYGADFDKEILFEEDRIRTFFVDQTNPKTLETLSQNLPEFLDLIIDDGLHAPNANIATLIFALPKLKSDGGWFIVEDIQSAAIPIWEVVISILPSNRYTSYLIETKQGWMFACQKMQEDEAPET